MKNQILFIILLVFVNLYSQHIRTPLEKKEFTKLTSHSELTSFISELDSISDLLSIEEIGKSVEGRSITVLKFSNSNFGQTSWKIKVLFFAQQHGNEQSGKEGALLLAAELLKEENKYLFERIDFALVPQVNPDGSEANKRRNHNGEDLNRNHLILTEPEIKALHSLYDDYLFQVTLDVHEYFPYGQIWEEYGFYKRADEQLGLTSNLNVSEVIRKYSKEKVLPYTADYLLKRGISFCEYVVGGPPNVERVRHSTVDINDGRQSFGIMNTLSFILEGKNGKDSIDNINNRSHNQSAAMMGLLNFVYENAEEIKFLVQEERKKLYLAGIPISIRMDHFPDGSDFSLPVEYALTGKDTIKQISNYHPQIKSLDEVVKPDAYLIRRDDSLLVEFLNNHNINFSEQVPEKLRIEQYILSSIDSIFLEGEKMIDIEVSIKQVTETERMRDYLIIPSDQIKGNILAIALEPRSMSGLINYDRFKYLLKAEEYPVMRAYKD